mgnify:CR=1 FL=1
MNRSLWNRALRLPFLTVSVLPYLCGAAWARAGFRLGPFLLGLVAVAAAHVSANLANDLGDALSGADDHDPRHYGFFGGAKLIQEGLVTARFTARLAVGFGALALLSGAAAVAWTDSPELAVLLVVGVVLGAEYTLPPLRLGYHRLGELAVFVLFGPVCVAAGAGLQGVSLAAPRLWLLSLPFGFLAASVLAANEVPDASTDAAAGKRTLVAALGPSRGYLVYLFLSLAALGTAVWGVASGILATVALGGAVGALPFVWRATRVLRAHYDEKPRLVRASLLAAGIHTAVGVVLVLAALL